MKEQIPRFSLSRNVCGLSADDVLAHQASYSPHTIFRQGNDQPI